MQIAGVPVHADAGSVQLGGSVVQLTSSTMRGAARPISVFVRGASLDLELRSGSLGARGMGEQAIQTVLPIRLVDGSLPHAIRAGPLEVRSDGARRDFLESPGCVLDHATIWYVRCSGMLSNSVQ